MIERPEILQSKTFKVPTGYGNLYITITEHNSKPFEVFCSIGKCGGSIMAKAEAVGRMTSLALRHEIPLNEIVEQLVDISGENLMPWKDTVIKSIPDAVGKVLRINYLKKE